MCFRCYNINVTFVIVTLLPRRGLYHKLEPYGDAELITLLNVAQGLNDRAKSRFTWSNWATFHQQTPVGMDITPEKYNHLSENRYEYQYKCHLRIPVQPWTSSTYELESMQIFKDGKTLTNVIATRPSVLVKEAFGGMTQVEAEVVKCNKLPLWRAKQLLSRTKADAMGEDTVDVANTCRDEACAKKAQEAQDRLQQNRAKAKQDAEKAIAKVDETTSTDEANGAAPLQATCLGLALLGGLFFA